MPHDGVMPTRGRTRHGNALPGVLTSAVVRLDSMLGGRTDGCGEAWRHGARRHGAVALRHFVVRAYGIAGAVVQLRVLENDAAGAGVRRRALLGALRLQTLQDVLERGHERAAGLCEAAGLGGRGHGCVCIPPCYGHGGRPRLRRSCQRGACIRECRHGPSPSAAAPWPGLLDALRQRRVTPITPKQPFGAAVKIGLAQRCPARTWCVTSGSRSGSSAPLTVCIPRSCAGVWDNHGDALSAPQAASETGRQTRLRGGYV